MGKKTKKALILAGGLGTRLRPLTFAVPKPLIPVRGRPILDYIISRLSRFGFNDIYISLNYHGDMIKLYLAQKNFKKLQLNYLSESSPLGTAGPLSLFKKNGIKIGRDESLLVMNGDIMTDLSFADFLSCHERSGADLSVAMINFAHQLSYGIIDLDDDNRIVDIREKPTLNYRASAGIYLVKGKCVELVPSKRYTMPELIESAARQGQLVKGYLIKEHWLAIEQIKNLEEVNDEKKGDWISKLRREK
ncbi:MAG: sugar phosphate nucleotidyltransferase [Candidatus Margulisiibacteriota bacterium]